MKQEKLYRYIGRNGIITSAVLLNGIDHIPMFYLEADPGFILTNGRLRLHAVTIEAEDLPLWYETVDNTKKDN